MPDLFVDDAFPPDSASIGDALPAAAKWLRHDEVFGRVSHGLPPAPAAVSEMGAVVQSPLLGDCWLLSPLAAIATHSPDTIRRVFSRCTPAEVKRGHIRVLLYRHGEWEEVAVDSLLPCDESGRPLFCGRFGGQSWAALIEKAAAKLSGSYAELVGGRSSEALVELTGGLCEAVHVAAGGEASLYSKLARWHAQKLAVCCRRRARPAPKAVAAAASAAVRAGGGAAAAPSPSAHSCALVGVGTHAGERAVLLRDVAEAEGGGGGKDDAPRDAWLPLRDFVERFDRLAVCHALPATRPRPALRPIGARAAGGSGGADGGAGGTGGYWLQHVVRVEPLHGGPPSGPRWAENPQFRLRCARKAAVIVAVSQKASARPVTGESRAPRARALALTALRALPAGGRAFSCEPVDVLGSCDAEVARELSLRLALKGGDEALVVPHALSSSHDGGDVVDDVLLRVWATEPCTLLPLPQLRRAHAELVTLEPGRNAGGRWPAASWGVGPQFALCADRDDEVLLLLERASDPASPDTSGAVVATADCIGLCAVTAAAKDEWGADGSEQGGGGGRALGRAASTLVLSGISGNVHSPRGALLPCVPHPSLGLSDSTLEAKGFLAATAAGRPRIQRRLRPAPRAARATAPAGLVAPGDALSEPGAEAAAEAAEAAAEAAGAAAEAAGSGAVPRGSHLAALRRRVRCPAAEVIAESDYSGREHAALRVSLRRGVPVLVTPSTHSPGRAGRFTLSALSTATVAFRALAPAHSATAAGAWRGRAQGLQSNAGGSRAESSWVINPQFSLRLDGNAPGQAAGDADGADEDVALTIVLSRPDAAWASARKWTPVESMVGLSVFEHTSAAPDAPTQRLCGDALRRATSDGSVGGEGGSHVRLVHASCYTAASELTCSLHARLSATSGRFILMPSTFGAGLYGPFALTVYSDRRMLLDTLDTLDTLETLAQREHPAVAGALGTAAA